MRVLRMAVFWGVAAALLLLAGCKPVTRMDEPEIASPPPGELVVLRLSTGRTPNRPLGAYYMLAT